MTSALGFKACTLDPGTEVGMHESELLAHIYARTPARPSVPVGPGDDAALIDIAGSLVLLTTDQLIEGRHYTPGAPPAAIAHKAIARSVSDIAAMGGVPRAALVAAALPPGFPGAKELVDRVHEAADRLGCPVVGGDLAATPGPACLTVTVLGLPHPHRGAVLRSGARVGDGVFVTGRVGNSYASGRHLAFTPRVAEAAALCDTLGVNLHAMIDLSDGLGRDAARVARASGVRLELDASRLPLHTDAPDPVRAAGDGEDYELLFTAAADAAPGATRIGRVVEGAGAVMRFENDQALDVASLGWDHRQ